MKYFKLSLIPLFILLTSCLDNSSSGYDDSEDQAFLEEYAQEEGVTETSNGLLYKVIEEGEGEKPSANEIVITDLKLEHIGSGQVVLDSYSRDYREIIPLEYITSNLIGLKEGLQLMNMGASYEMVLPSHLAWNDGKVYKLQIDFHSTQDIFVNNYASQEDVQVTESGLYYRIIDEGEGDKPEENSTVVVDYKGTLINGFEFDSGESSSFSVGEVIDGFGEGLQLMNTGSTYEFLLPANLAYGDEPPSTAIYPGAALVFEVDLLEIE